MEMPDFQSGDLSPAFPISSEALLPSPQILSPDFYSTCLAILFQSSFLLKC